jgi:hypothetical protein
VVYGRIHLKMGWTEECELGWVFAGDVWHHVVLTKDGRFLTGYMDGTIYSADCQKAVLLWGALPSFLGERSEGRFCPPPLTCQHLLCVSSNPLTFRRREPTAQRRR